MKIVYLKPISSFTRQPHSDTIWGLLCWGLANLYGKDFLEQFIEDHKSGTDVVKVSSTFRYFVNELKAKEQAKTLMFPKPKLPSFTWADIASGKSKSDSLLLYNMLKKYKKKRYLNQIELAEVLNGRKSDLDLFEEFCKQEAGSKNAASALNQNKIPEQFRNEQVMHNTIDRLSGSVLEGALFVREEIYTKQSSGLFFLLDASQKYQQAVEGALRFLAHTGFGGDATVGKNHFTVEMDEFSIELSPEASHFCTLSLYAPAKDELRAFNSQKKTVFYEPHVRKGKAGGKYYQIQEFWKDSVLTLAEGSVFPLQNKSSYGRITLVKRKTDAKEAVPFNVYHNGIAFALPVKFKETK